jgi:hypothetical protein
MAGQFGPRSILLLSGVSSLAAALVALLPRHRPAADATLAVEDAHDAA